MNKKLLWLVPIALAVLVFLLLLVGDGGSSQPHVYNPF